MYLAILIGLAAVCSEATVTLSVVNSVDGGAILECNSEVIVICRIDPYTQLVNWEVNKTLYAMCSPGCLDNPPFPGNYSFTFDVVNGVFNLTINQVTFGDNNTFLKCDDGSDAGSITTEVIPAYSDHVTYVNRTEGGNLITFTTACVYPDVDVKWYTFKGDNLDEKLYDTKPIEREDNTSCTFDKKCSGTGTAKITSTIEVSTVSEGEERFFKVVVIYKNPDARRTFVFDEPFMLKKVLKKVLKKALNNSSSNPNSTISQSNTSNENAQVPTDSSFTMLYTTSSMHIENGSGDGLTIVLSVIGVCIGSALFVVTIFAIYKIRKKRTFTESTGLQNFDKI